ncbi:MAG: hypothetical protein QXO84_00800 [Candidatus Aenigmatarchaeota archaeon]
MKGLNEFVAIAIILSIAISGIVISMEFIKPMIEKSRDNFIVNEAISNILKIRDTLYEIVNEGEGSRRLINIVVSDGTYTFDENADAINFTYQMKGNLVFLGEKRGIQIRTVDRQLIMSLNFSNIDFINEFYIYKGSKTIMLSYEDFENGKAKISISD